MEHAEKCAKLFRENHEEIGGILISLPNFGDEAATVAAVAGSGLRVPILVHAADDDKDRMDISNRRDAFCGKISVCNNLRQFGFKFTNTTYHTSDTESGVFKEDLRNFMKICEVYRNLNSAKIAQIGTRPAAFRTVRFSEKLLQKSGITVIPADVLEIKGRADSISDQAALDGWMRKTRGYGQICYKNDSAVLASAKLTMALDGWMRENGCAAGAFQCWDAIQKYYGCGSCLSMSMLGEEGIPMACETDVMGAVAMYALYLASGQPSAYLDWNNSYGEDRDQCIVFHCGNFPKSFLGIEKPEISELDILGATLGYDNCFGAVKGQIRSGGMTFANLITDDENGRIRAYVGEGEFTDQKVETVGAPGVCRIPNLQDLMKYICGNGFSHHIAMNKSKTASVLTEVFGNYMGWDLYRHR